MLYLFRNISWLSFTQSLMNVCILIWRVVIYIHCCYPPCHIPPLAQARPMMLCIYTSNVIGASLSEPHTSELNGGIIGASLSEPHTSELNGGIFLIYICTYRTSYVQCTRTRAACGQKACDLLTTRAILDTFKFRAFSLLVVNMDTSSTSRRSLKPSEDREDRLRRRRERVKARRAAETAEERQERLAKRRERDRARRSTEANNKRRERERAQRVAETDKKKQERLKKRREIGADVLLRLPMKETPDYI